jgi:hypothetical protein
MLSCDRSPAIEGNEIELEASRLERGAPDHIPIDGKQ